MVGFRSFINLALFCWVLSQTLTLQASAHDTPESSEAVPKPRDGPAAAASAVAAQPVSSHTTEESSEGASGSKNSEAEAPGIRRMGKHRSDKSVAGGGVIIGGLVTAIFAAVFCYIRVTRRRGGVY